MWVVAGSLTMYAMAVALAEEMADYPGGPKALAASVRRGAEALRPMRWPAERLDTLGGYLTYHTMTLFTLFLSIYGAVQGARAVRAAEDGHSLEEVLAAGWSRTAVIRDRATGFFVTTLLIALGLGLGIAVSMAAGVSNVVVAVLYVATNLWDELGPFAAVRFVSPFYYANKSRAPWSPGTAWTLPRPSCSSRWPRSSWRWRRARSSGATTGPRSGAGRESPSRAGRLGSSARC